MLILMYLWHELSSDFQRLRIGSVIDQYYNKLGRLPYYIQAGKEKEKKKV